jgi:hypothetical protein
MLILYRVVNEILGGHNVDKQITDNKGDVSGIISCLSEFLELI